MSYLYLIINGESVSEYLSGEHECISVLYTLSIVSLSLGLNTTYT